MGVAHPEARRRAWLVQRPPRPSQNVRACNPRTRVPPKTGVLMAEPTSPHLERGLNLLHATSLNVANMLGAGPFITIPVLLGTMIGPQAMIGWAVALVIVMCDGLIWAELGAAFPGTGGTYHYLREIFKGSPWGRFLPFLFIWQFLISGTLEVASGYIGASDFVMSLCPTFHERLAHWR